MAAGPEDMQRLPRDAGGRGGQTRWTRSWRCAACRVIRLSEHHPVTGICLREPHHLATQFLHACRSYDLVRCLSRVLLRAAESDDKVDRRCQDERAEQVGQQGLP
jgi:hypothetical protein